MSTFVTPPFISEREKEHVSPTGLHDDAKPEDCVWDSGLMQFLGSHPGAAPATHAEAEALRAIAKPNAPMGASNTSDLLKAFKARYGFEPTRLAPGPDSIVAALQPGTIATVSGKLANFPDGHRLRRWSPTFKDGHRVCVYRTANEIRWLDPLGRVETGYRGDDVTIADVRTFARGLDSHTISAMATREGDVQFVNLNEFKARSGRTLTIPLGTPLLKLDGTVLLNTERELTVPCYGFADAMAGQFVVEIVTTRLYKDGKGRPTLVMVKLPDGKLADVPV
jgi:hypothetical protein